MLEHFQLQLDDRETVTGDSVDTVLKSLLAAGEPVTYGCGAGNCGACRYRLVSGQVAQKETNILSPAQIDEGQILTCQSRPRSDLVLQTPSRVAGDPVVVNGTITRAERPTTDLVKLRVKLEHVLDFEPGQYGLLKTPYGPARPYSFASAPNSPVVEFHIRAVPGGRAGQPIYDSAKRGDPIQLTAPLGEAYAQDLNRPLCLIATGTGMAPIKSVLARLKQTGHPGPIKVIWGNRSEDDLYDMAAIEGLLSDIDDAELITVFSRQGTCQRVTDVLPTTVPSLMGWVAFCAGNPDMVRAVESQVAVMGLGINDFHADPFTPAEE